MNIILAIGWSFVLVISIIECAFGGSPSWFNYFCCLIPLALDSWIDFIIHKKR